MLVRLGEDVDLSPFMENGVLEECFDKDKLDKFDLKGITWWDEVHKKCRIGALREGATDRVVFPTNDAGEYDPKNGTYKKEDEDRAQVLTVKFPKEGRFCLGVAIAPTNETKGKHAELFDYSGKTIVTIPEWKELEDKEIRRVKALKKGAWFYSGRDATAVYLDDDIKTFRAKSSKNKIDGFGKATCDKLAAEGIKTVSNVREKLSNAIISTLIADRVSMEVINKLKDTCDKVSTNAPPSRRHLDADNPYESRYGADWKGEMEKALSSHCCITKLIEHIIRESGALYKGTL